MAELRKHRSLSEIIFGLGMEEIINLADVDGRMLVYPYNAALEDRVKGENKAFLMQKYGADAIQAASMAAKACDNGIAPEDWLHQLTRVYRDFKIVNVMGRITKQIEKSDEVDYAALKEEIDGRLSASNTEPLAWADLQGEFDHEWLWNGWIPHGELTILVGQQGSGKSAFALDFADSVANGKSLPDDSYVGKNHGVLWVETEGRFAENVRRAQAWGVDTRNIYIPSHDMRRVINLERPDDITLIRSQAMRPEVGLVVIDSLGGSLMNENEASAKKVLQEMARMAQETETTFLIIHHLRKMQKQSKGHQSPTLNDVRGHSGITQFAPSVIAIDYEGHEMPRFLTPLKMNLVEPQPSMIFTIGSLGLIWNESTQDQVWRTVVDETVKWLEDLLSNGPISIKEVLDTAEDAGYSKKVIKQAINYPSIKMVTHGGERCLIV